MKHPITFGTDGWRGVIGVDFDFDHVVSVAQAINDYVTKELKAGPGRIAIGYDCRFLSLEAARTAAQFLAQCSHNVELADRAVTTPAVSHYTLTQGLDVGVMITASHNPALFNGVKIKGSYGGSLTPDRVAALTKHLPTSIPEYQPIVRNDQELNGVENVPMASDHAQAVKAFANVQNLSGLKVVVDAMYGSSQGVFADLLRELGAEVVEIRGEFNPSFGGSNPEPLAKNTSELSATVRAQKAHVGFAIDGDGDRIGACDEEGTFVDSHRIFGLLLEYLVTRQKRTGRVVKTVSTTHLIDRMSEKLGLECLTTPVGFKHICSEMLKGGVLMGGEESGGIGFSDYMPERDAMLCALWLADLLKKDGHIESMKQHVTNMLETYGTQEYVRHDIHVEKDPKAIINFLQNNPPQQVGSEKVKRVETEDGVKLHLEQAWILMRASGTEPLLRVYVEAESLDHVDRVAEEAKELVVNTQEHL